MELPFHRFKYSQRQGMGLPWTHKHHRSFGQPYHRMETCAHSSANRVLSSMPMSSAANKSFR